MMKLGKRKIVILCVAMAALLIMGLVAGILISKSVQSGREDEKNVFLALLYLKDYDYELAGGYLNRVSDGASRKVSFAKDSAEVVRQKLIGNETLSSIGIDIIDNNYRLDSTQSTIVAFLKSGPTDMTDGYGGVIDEIVRQMKIPDSRRTKYEEQYDIERMAMMYGYLDKEQAETYEALCGKKARCELEIGSALSNGNYNRAFDVAVDIVEDDPSNENYMVLADVISRAVHADAYLDESYLYTVLDKEYDEESLHKDSPETNKEIESIGSAIFGLETMLRTETDETAIADINEKLDDLRAELQTLEIKRDNPFLYRAMNSIRIMSGVQYRIVMAKLLYAAGLYDEAKTCIQDAAGSFGIRFCDNSDIVRGLDLLDNLYNGDGSASVESQASSLVARMINGVLDNLFIRDNVYTIGFADVFANFLLEEYKYQKNDIYITSVDDSAYPEITVTVNGRGEIISDIISKKNVVVRDTHYDVDYKVERDETSVASICFVVDISGSMDGEPIINAQKALRSFIATLDGNTEVSIVAFDDGAYERTPLTMNASELLAGVETLVPWGGTDISVGISGGIESLKNASGVKNLILMTDGQSAENFNWKNDAIADGITIFTVGFGSVNTEYLTQIAEVTGGTFTLADSSGDLGSVYSSIGSVISNRAKITYTVTENVDVAPRYVYIRSEKYHVSQARDYRETNSKHLKTADTFVVFNSVSFAKSDLDWYQSQGNDIWVQLETSANSDVDTLVIDGQTITPEGDGYWYLEFRIPLLKEGLYDISFTFKDGSSCTAEDVILVYDNLETGNATVLYNDVKIGSMVLRSDMIVILPNGTVVIQNAQFHEADSERYKWSLNAYTNNFLIFDSVTVTENAVDGYLDWGTDATFRLHGRIVLSSSDAQNAGGYETISSSGKLTGVISKDQCAVKASDH